MRKSIFILLLIFAFNLKAQDIHFSQFTISKIGLNPALVGSQQTDYKTRFQKRTQWKSVANPFSTIAIGFEAKSLMKKTAAGFEFFNDKAGDAHFTTSKFNAAISRTFTLDKQQQISAGLLLGFAQRKVDFSALIFEQVEQLKNPSFSFFDIGIGTNYSRMLNDSFSFLAGFSAYHINRPQQSLIEEDVRLEEKYNSYLISSYRINNRLVLYPSLLYSRQGKSAELLFGSGINYMLNNNTTLNSQLFYRWDDAIIPAFGINYNSITAIVSYDINHSDLTAASNYKGGFEFSLTYVWNKKKQIEKTKYCPKYL